MNHDGANELPGGETPQFRSIGEPPRRTRRVLLWIAIGIGGLAVLATLLLTLRGDNWLSRRFGNRPTAKEANTQTAAKQLWTCGMHPQVIQDHPGQCPICGMTLVPVRTGGQGAPAVKDAGAGERKILFYRSPMDPSVTSPVPRKDDMGMDYVPVYADESQHDESGGATVTIDPAVVQNMNVQIAPVTRRDLSRQIRTVGYLDYDQEKMVSVTTKYSGFIEKVYVNYLGQPVRKGDPLFEIYSPELVQTEQELLSARDYVRRLKDAPAETRQRAQSLLDSVRSRMLFWDIAESQMKRIEESNDTLRTLTVVALSSGLVMKRTPGLEGMAVKPGMEIMHIANVSTLWLSVEVFENQIPWVNVGSRATVTLTYLPGETFHGLVRYVEPEVSEKTRTIQLTLEVPNADGRLRAGMYATVLFEPNVAQKVIAIPSLAVIRTGKRNVVVVAIGGGRFTPRDVVLGAEGDGYFEVLSGLKDGENVVTSAQFLIDSESNLREAIQKLIAAKAQRPQESGNAK